MAKYLTQFRDLITKRQTAQVLNLLNEKKNTGRIRTINEFNAQLNDLVRDILDNELKPFLSIFEARGYEKIDSESFNYMLDRLQDDLTSAFEEASNIGTTVQGHEAIARDIIFKKIREALNDLERRLVAYKFFDQDATGLTNALYSTFKEGGPRIGRGSKEILLFTDPRTNTLLDVENDAVLDLGGERLVLSEDKTTYHTITKAEQLFDSTAKQSEVLVEPAFSSLKNMTDGIQGTYWLQSLLFSNPQSAVRIKVALFLGGPRDVNFVEVEPATKNGAILETIEYIDASNEQLTLASPNLFISTRKKVSVNRVHAKKIILTFINYAPRRVEFEYNEDVVPLFDQAENEPLEGYTPSIKLLTNELDSLVVNSDVKDILNIVDPSDNNKVFVGYEYTFGIDNVWVGNVEYDDIGVYAAGHITVDKLGRCVLRSTETRPITSGQDIIDTSTTYDLSDTNMVHSSIEYYVFKKDYDDVGTLLRSAVIPIVPQNIERINHERLLLSEKSSSGVVNDIGNTLLFTNRTAGDVKVYKNGEELTDVTDGGASGWLDVSDSNDRTPNSGDPMTMKIQVLDPHEGDIYTVSYDILSSTTSIIPETLSEYTTRSGALVSDLTGDLSAVLLRDNSVLINRDLLGVEVAYSDVFMIIIIRRNASTVTVTASVEDFILGTAGESKEFEL